MDIAARKMELMDWLIHNNDKRKKSTHLLPKSKVLTELKNDYKTNKRPLQKERFFAEKV
jgi:hypothetical protein